MAALSPSQCVALIERSPMLVWRAGRDPRRDWFNASWLSFTGRAAEQEIGDGWLGGVHPADREGLRAAMARGFAAGASFDLEYRLQRSDGHFRAMLDRAIPFADESGALAGFIGSALDIDERRNAEEQKQVFATMIAHELRTPLMPLQTAPTLIRRRIKEGKDLEPMLASIERQVNRLSRLVTALSEVPRIEAAPPVSLDLEHVELVQFLRETIEAHDQALGSRNVRRHPITLETPAPPVPLLIDGDRMRQALYNLLENAVKYSPEGGAIAVRCAADAATARIEIADRGIGIPHDEQAHLTQRFFRASNASPERFPGLGLGLAIARQIAEAHGGTLAIESEPGRGTKVTLALPIDRTEQGAP